MVNKLKIVILVIAIIGGIVLMYLSGGKGGLIIDEQTLSFDVQLKDGITLNNEFRFDYDFTTKEGIISFLIPEDYKLHDFTIHTPNQLNEVSLFINECFDPFNLGWCNESEDVKIDLITCIEDSNNLDCRDPQGDKIKSLFKNIKEKYLKINYNSNYVYFFEPNSGDIFSGKVVKLKFKTELNLNSYYYIHRRAGEWGINANLFFKFPKDYTCKDDCFKNKYGAEHKWISGRESRIILTNKGESRTNYFLITPQYRRTLFKIDSENLLLGLGISLFTGAFLMIISEIFKR